MTDWERRAWGEAIEDAWDERQEAIDKHGPNTTDNPNLSRHGKMLVLVKQVGDLAKAVHTAGDARRELIQIAAVALMWATAEAPQDR
jgi:hypothetical protein